MELPLTDFFFCKFAKEAEVVTQWKENKYKNSVSVRECLNVPILWGMTTGGRSEESQAT